ncbi:phage minor capsid protein [Glycomyces sp. YM15]|uniref:phage minor capsid protein n=1 Tax=Glycomyces sp. YM15 TaxID=2800446 RepID=UPI00196575B7|nr:phage minor capsid protein [Glycomyces sp. YM15]
MPVSRLTGEPFAAPVAAHLVPFTDSVLAAATGALRDGTAMGRSGMLRAYQDGARHLEGLHLSCLRALVGAWAAGAAAAGRDLPGAATGLDADDVTALRAFADGSSHQSFLQLQRQVPQLAAVRTAASDLSHALQDAAESSRAGTEHAMHAVNEAANASPEPEAARGRAWDQFLAKGVRTAADDHGRTWELTEYADMAARTASGTTAVDAYLHVLTGSGVASVTVSVSAEHCPVCAPWEGRTLALTPEGADQTAPGSSTATLAEARTAGLLHPNCRHRLRASTAAAPTPDEPEPAAASEVRKAERRVRRLERQAAYAIETSTGRRAAAAAAKALTELEALRPTAPATSLDADLDGMADQSPPEGPNGWVVSAADLVRPWNPSDRREALHELLEDEPLDVPGFGPVTVDLQDVTISDTHISFKGDLRGPGYVVGSFDHSITRDGDTVEARHDELVIFDGYRGNGIGSAFHGRLLDWYEDSDVNAFTLTAGYTVGGYAWARAGFGFVNEDDAERILERLDNHVRQLDVLAEPLRAAHDDGQLTDRETAGLAWMEAQITAGQAVRDRASSAAFGTPAYPTPADIANAGRTHPLPDGFTDIGLEHHIGKATLLGSSWDGIKYLAPQRNSGNAVPAAAPTTAPPRPSELPAGPGNWPVSAADLTRPFPDDARREAVQALFENEPWLVPGLGELTCDLKTVIVNRTGVEANGNLRLNGTIVARFDRSIYVEDGMLQAAHSSLTVDNDFRGQGIAAAFNNRLFGWYRESNVDAVTVSTADIGGYAWARAGFRFLTEDDAHHVIGRVNENRRAFNQYAADLRRTSRERPLTEAEAAGLAWMEAQLDAADPILDRAETHEFGTPGFPTPNEFASIGRSIPAPVGLTGEIYSQHLGKHAMIGAGWDGIMFLNRTPTSRTDSDADPGAEGSADEATPEPDASSDDSPAADRITVPIGQLLTSPGEQPQVAAVQGFAQQAAREYAAVHPDAPYRLTDAAVTPETGATTFSYNVVDTAGNWAGFAEYTARGDDTDPILELTNTAVSGPVREFAEAFALQWQVDADATPGLDVHPSAVLAGGVDPAASPFLRRVRQAVADATDAFQYDSDANPDGYTLRRVGLDVAGTSTSIEFDVIDEDDDLLGTIIVRVGADGAALTDSYPAASFPAFADDLESLGEAFVGAWNRSPVPDAAPSANASGPHALPGLGNEQFPILASDLFASDLPLPAVREAVADVFEFGDWDGFGVEVASVNQAGDSWTIRGDFIVDGVNAGPFTRTIVRGDDGIDVHHTYLHLGPEFQGRGIAKAFNGRLFDWYRASRVRRVEVYASLDVGGYAWARAGFTWAEEADANDMWRQLAAAARRYQDLAAAKREQATAYAADPVAAEYLRAEAHAFEQQAQAAFAFLERVDAAAWGSPDYPSPKDLSEVGMPPGRSREAQWIGKEVLLSLPWNGVQWIDGT